MNSSLCEHKSGQMHQAVKQPLTWIPETSDARFPVSVNPLKWAVYPHFYSALSKFKCLGAKHSCLNPLWAYFLVTCPRLDPNDGITARGCAWMSPEETVVVFVQCFYTDVPKTWISNFRNRFLQRTSTSQDRFALRQLLWPDFSTWKPFDSSAKVIPSLHVISLAVRDRQWNELPAKFKITWRHSNRPIRWRP